MRHLAQFHQCLLIAWALGLALEIQKTTKTRSLFSEIPQTNLDGRQNTNES